MVAERVGTNRNSKPQATKKLQTPNLNHAGTALQVLSNFVASCEDFLTQAAEVFAEERRGKFLCGLCENLGGLCVESGAGDLVAALPRCDFPF